MAKKKTTAKIGKRPSKKKPTKAAKPTEKATSPKSGKTAADHQKTIDTLEAKAKKGDKDAIAALTQIVKRYNKWRGKQAEQKATAFGMREEIKAAEVALGDAVTAPQAAGDTTEDAAKQLGVVQSKYQELEELKAAAKEKNNTAKAETKAAAEALERAIGEGTQPTLFPDQDKG